ncbi:MAG: 23S rRNA (pseudouridine(1915)-N(3))-methyltransferase RlmH [Candidatus Saccharimonadales bacterium]
MIRIIAIGKKHDSWIEDGLLRYQKRLRAPFNVEWQLLPYSTKSHQEARDSESDAIMTRIKPGDFVLLLDERGKNLSSPEFSRLIEREAGQKPIVIVIGGAYGVNDAIMQRANIVWSLSRLVFPHMLVRLLLTEQLYRAQEIARGGPYHHN